MRGSREVERLVRAAFGVLAVLLLCGLEARPLPSALPQTSVNYGKDRRLELSLYGAKIGEFRRAPFRVGTSAGYNLRIARVAPRAGDPQDVISTRRLGVLAPLVPFKWPMVFVVILIGTALVSPWREAAAEVLTSVLASLYGLALIAIGVYGAVFSPAPAGRMVENASTGALLLLPFYIACWLTFVLAFLAGVLILLRRRWAGSLAIAAQLLLFVSVWGLMFAAIEAREGYRVERIGVALYVACHVAPLALSTWFLRRRSPANT
jgi:hypothetical protein